MKCIHISELPEHFFKQSVLEIPPIVFEIIDQVKRNGDDAVLNYTAMFDKVNISRMKMNIDELQSAYISISDNLKKSLDTAIINIRKFAQKQMEQFINFEYEINTGMILGQRVIPIEKIGVYVPGGRFPLISSLLMGVIPAQTVGCEQIIVCTPPSIYGKPAPEILAAAYLLNLQEVYTIGGVQAIAAMAFGTNSIPQVDKIVGPGNKYVAAAKKVLYGIVGIDFIAGPTEVMIIADESANPRWIAADMLSQAEHDIDASAILVTTSESIAEKVQDELISQLNKIPHSEISKISLNTHGYIIIVDTLDQAIELANQKAPEHLELHILNSEEYSFQFRNYGTLFIGEYAVEPLGDYTCGLNHTLPTNRNARFTSGLSVRDFIKLQTTLKTNQSALRHIAPDTVVFAESEGLIKHANAVRIRLESS